ncbi:alpha-galactosidase [bacterium]|nr:alpha-galactosidase [bacterium]
MTVLICVACSAGGKSSGPDNGCTLAIPAGTGPLIITWDHSTRLALDWSAPGTRPAAPEAAGWTHKGRAVAALALAGRDGVCTADTFSAPGLELVRQVWLARDSDALALRLTLCNTGAEPLRLEALTPLSCRGPESFILDGRGAQDWSLLVQRRQKNDIPSVEKPRPGLHLEADPFFLLRADSASGPELLCGFITQLGCLSELDLSFGERDGRPALDSLAARCEFGGVELPPLGERTSQWVYLRSGPDPNGLMADFAERMGSCYGVPQPPRPSPTVFCSWYYYGPFFSEKHLDASLAHLKKDRIPFDVYLIDDCWEQAWGDWYANGRWPGGMQQAAGRISALGYRPGLWTCPLLAAKDSRLAVEHPDWMLRLEDGSLFIFPMDEHVNFVLDPTAPGVCDFLEQTYRRLSVDYGFSYHKLDFMRAVLAEGGLRFHDPRSTCLEAYRLALEAVRRGAGAGAYISVCGGHYGASLGIADSQRSGSDLVADWEDISPKFKQNLLRLWMGRLWHIDPDAMMVRRNEHRKKAGGYENLALGRFSDEESRTIALNQYIVGNMVCFCEDFDSLDEDRKALYRHVIPSISTAAVALDPFEPTCPSLFLTRVTPRCGGLLPWITLSVVNWTDSTQSVEVALSGEVTGSLAGTRFLVSEFFSRRVLGIYQSGQRCELGALEPHSCRLLRIAPWDGESPVLAGTDLHFSGGGVEVAQWRTAGDSLAEGQIETRWNYPVRVTVAFPADNAAGFAAETAVLEAGQKAFSLRRQ